MAPTSFIDYSDAENDSDSVDSDCVAISSAPDTSTVCPSAAVSSAGRQAKKRKKTSWVHNHVAIDNDGLQKCAIGRCKASYGPKTGTGTLAGHLRQAHGIRPESGTSAVHNPNQTTFTSDGSGLVVRHLRIFGNSLLSHCDLLGSQPAFRPGSKTDI